MDPDPDLAPDPDPAPDPTPFFSDFKDIVQPFELGGETRFIQSAVKYWKPGMF
jgi:hypothetical protein